MRKAANAATTDRRRTEEAFLRKMASPASGYDRAKAPTFVV